MGDLITETSRISGFSHNYSTGTENGVVWVFEVFEIYYAQRYWDKTRSDFFLFFFLCLKFNDIETKTAPGIFIFFLGFFRMKVWGQSTSIIVGTPSPRVTDLPR